MRCDQKLLCGLRGWWQGKVGKEWVMGTRDREKVRKLRRPSSASCHYSALQPQWLWQTDSRVVPMILDSRCSHPCVSSFPSVWIDPATHF